MSQGSINLPIEGGTGGAVTWKDTVTSVADLPGSGNVLGDARVVTDNNAVFIWGADDAWHAPAGGGPAGADTQIQFNDVGALGASAGFTYTASTQQLLVGDGTSTTGVLLVGSVGGVGGIISGQQQYTYIGNSYWQTYFAITSAGLNLASNNGRAEVFWSPDNTYDLGAFNNGANLGRPRDLYVGRNARIEGSLGIGNSDVGSTLGTVVKKIEIFDATGTSLGFIPVYDSIT